MPGSNQTCPYCNGSIPDGSEVCYCGRTLRYAPSTSSLKDPSIVTERATRNDATAAPIAPDNNVSTSDRHRAPTKTQITLALAAAAFLALYCAYLAISPYIDNRGTFGLSVSNLHDDVSYEGSFVLGTVSNTTDRNFQYVQVEIGLYSNGHLTGSTMANVNNLGPHRKWDFRAYTFAYPYSSYKVERVTAL